MYLDYSKQNITEQELEFLITGAGKRGLTEKIEAMFSGDKINITEKRSVLHTILRASANEKLNVLPNGAEVIETEHRMAEIVDDIRHGKLTGYRWR